MLSHLLFLARLSAVAAATPPMPFDKGSSLLMTDKECEWGDDVSAQHVIGLGLAGGPGSRPQQSAEACEKWCCETDKMRFVKSTVSAAWKFHEMADGNVPRQCGIWQWKEAPTQTDPYQKGCWVAAEDFVVGQKNSVCPSCGKGQNRDTTWFGAQHCLDPGGGGWGTTVVIFIVVGSSAYLGLGVAYGHKTGRRGGSFGPLSPHPHAQHWISVVGLVADGVGFVLGRRARSNSRKPLLPSPEKSAKKDKKRQRERQNESGGGSSKKEKKEKKQKGGARGERAGGMEVAVAPTEAEQRLLQEQTESGVHSSQAKIKVTSQ